MTDQGLGCIALANVNGLLDPYRERLSSYRTMKRPVVTGLAPFFPRECTERASRVKPLRFAPTAARAHLTRGLDSSSSPLLSCLH